MELGCALLILISPTSLLLTDALSCALLAERSTCRGLAGSPDTSHRCIIRGCCWQAWDDESSMVCWGLALITAVIYWQLPYPLTTAITSRVIVVQRDENPSVCYLRVYMWTRLSKVRHKGQSELRAAHFFICAQFSNIFLKIRNFSMSFILVVIRINPLAPSVIFKSNICLAVKHNLLCIVCIWGNWKPCRNLNADRLLMHTIEQTTEYILVRQWLIYLVSTLTLFFITIIYW